MRPFKATPAGKRYAISAVSHQARPQRARAQPHIRCQRVELKHVRGGTAVDIVHRGSGLTWATNTGAAVWDGARLLAGFISGPGFAAHLAAYHEGPWSWDGRNVIELGCGLGFLSITAALLGARIVATDGDSSMVSATRANIAEAAASHGLAHPPRVLRLPWGNDQALKQADIPLPVDIILGSELVYGNDVAVWDKLIWTLQRLAGPDTLIITAETVRKELQSRQGTGYDAWFAALEAGGFSVTEVDPGQLDCSTITTPVKLWIIRRQTEGGQIL